MSLIIIYIIVPKKIFANQPTKCIKVLVNHDHVFLSQKFKKLFRKENLEIFTKLVY